MISKGHHDFDNKIDFSYKHAMQTNMCLQNMACLAQIVISQTNVICLKNEFAKQCSFLL